jgi:hypothetical protein
LFISLPDAPQGVGDLVGIACRLVRGNIKEFWNFLLVPTVFATIAGIVFQWVFTYGASAVSQNKDIGAAFGLAGVFFVGLVVFVIAWWILGLRLLAIARTVLRFSPDLAHAKAYMYRRKWAVLGVYFLTFILLMASMIAWAFVAAGPAMVTGGKASVFAALGVTLGVIGMTVTLVVYLLVSHLALVLVACEEQSVVEVIGRAISLVFRHFWRSVAFGIVFAVTFTVISYPMSLPVAVITFTDAIQHGIAAAGGEYKPPLHVLVIAQTWESLMGMYLRPLVVIGFGLFYYDLRLRSEGLDIKRKLQLMMPEAGEWVSET